MKKIILLIIIMMFSVGAAPNRPNTYTAGQVIEPDENNQNENTLYNYLQNGVDTYVAGSIDNADINASADIAVTKIAGTAATTTTAQTITGAKTFSGNQTFSGNVTLPATGVTIGTMSVGRTWYDDGTDVAALAAGTAGQVYQANGAAAPSWESVAASNVIFAWSGCESYTANEAGMYFDTTADPDADTGALGYQFFVSSLTTYTTFQNFKFKKSAQISTVSIYARLYNKEGSKTGTLNVDIGGAAGTVTNTGTSWAWATVGTVDVSGLTNGTVYDGIIQLKGDDAGSDYYCSAVTLIGS